jgi:hypothetical protein
MSNSMCDYMIDRPVDQLYEGNLHVLNPMYESHGSVVDPIYVKILDKLYIMVFMFF